MLAWFMLGCSLKSGVSMLQMDKQYDTLNTPKNRESQFEWAMAEEYRDKAKEEYASSQFQDAEILAAEAVMWMQVEIEVEVEKGQCWPRPWFASCASHVRWPRQE